MIKILSAIIPIFIIRRFLPYDSERIRCSFHPIRARISEYAPTFYELFWKDYPETVDLFGKNMTRTELDTRINHFMLFMVENIDNPHVYLHFIEHLAVRHINYGIFSHQFEFVGSTNIKTLKKMLGDQFTQEDEKEWKKAFEYLTFLMKLSAKFKKRDVTSHREIQLDRQ